MDAKPEVSSSIESTLIKEAHYDPFMSVLTLTFYNGGIYEYIEVPKKTYEELTESTSAGKYFHTSIKNKFEFLRRK